MCIKNTGQYVMTIKMHSARTRMYLNSFNRTEMHSLHFKSTSKLKAQHMQQTCTALLHLWASYVYVVKPFEGAFPCFSFDVHVFTPIVNDDQGEVFVLCLFVDLSKTSKTAGAKYVAGAKQLEQNSWSKTAGAKQLEQNSRPKVKG